MTEFTTSKPAEAPAKKGLTFDLGQMEPWREFAVVLHDDMVHDQKEVVCQLMKALNCSFQRAHAHMRRAENNGKAIVAITNRQRAFEIAGVLKQIDLRVVLRQIN